jgi:hypothetical protein
MGIPQFDNQFCKKFSEEFSEPGAAKASGIE